MKNGVKNIQAAVYNGTRRVYYVIPLLFWKFITLISGLRWPLPVDNCRVWDEEENKIRCSNEDLVTCYYVLDFCDSFIG